MDLALERDIPLDADLEAPRPLEADIPPILDLEALRVIEAIIYIENKKN
jgi:hypothetical protein